MNQQPIRKSRVKFVICVVLLVGLGGTGTAIYFFVRWINWLVK